MFHGHPHRWLIDLPGVAAIVFLSAVMAPAVAQESKQTADDSLDVARRRQIAAWIAELDDDKFEVRETASRRLLAEGDAAIPILESYARHPSPEVRFRVDAVLKSLAQLPLARLREEMESFCTLPQERLDVERALCLIARLMDRRVREQDLLHQLDNLAAKVKERLALEPEPIRMGPQHVLAVLQQVLFKDYGFCGNEEDYGNPDNCSLAFVLRERKGKPILLAEIMVAVARRNKVPIVGVPGAGRYIAKYDGAQAPEGFPRDDIYLDPFDGGVILSREDRQRLFPSADPDIVAPPATNLEIISRTLRNITADYQNRGPSADPNGQELVARMLELLEARSAAP